MGHLCQKIMVKTNLGLVLWLGVAFPLSFLLVHAFCFYVYLIMLVHAAMKLWFSEYTFFDSRIYAQFFCTGDTCQVFSYDICDLLTHFQCVYFTFSFKLFCNSSFWVVRLFIPSIFMWFVFFAKSLSLERGCLLQSAMARAVWRFS